MRRNNLIVFLTACIIGVSACSHATEKNFSDTAISMPEEKMQQIACKIDYTPAELEINMKTTATDLEGYVYGYYFATIAGKKYRYKAVYNRDDLGTADKIVYEFVENANTDNEKHNKVYSLKEYPGYERLQCRCDEFDDLVYLLEYAPPLNDVEFTLDELKNDGFVVIEDDDCCYGDDIWMNFVNQTEKNEKAAVWICYLTTGPGPNVKLKSIQPAEELIQATRDDFPKMQLMQVYFDGTQYIFSPIHKVNGEYVIYYRDGYDMEEGSFKYMVHLVDETKSPEASYESLERYILSDEKNLTTEWIRAVAGIGESMPYVRFIPVYYKYKWG